MSHDDDIPTLTDLIRNGLHPSDPGPDVELIEDVEDEDMTIDLATHQPLGTTPPPTPADDTPPLPSALDEQGELDNIDGVSEDSNINELIVEEEIRLILDKHMEAAYEEILRLIQHKIR